MKNLWSQVTEEEFNLKGLHNQPKVRPGLRAGCLEWAGGASRKQDTDCNFRAMRSSFPFRQITSLIWDDYPY